MKTTVDILLVGAGPIGLELACSLKENKLDYVHIEAGSIASTIEWYSPGTEIFSSPERLAIAGIAFEVYPHNKATREDYLHYLRTVTRTYDLPIETYTRLVHAENKDGTFICTLSNSAHGVGGEKEYKRVSDKLEAKNTTKISCKKIILAIGNMHVPHEINIPGEQSEFVSHYFNEPHTYYGQNITIIGAGNSAIEAALRLYKVGCKITLCSRNDLIKTTIKPWLLPEFESLVREEKIIFKTNSIPQKIESKSLTILRDGATEVINSDRFLLLTGYDQRRDIFDFLGCELTGPSNRPIINEKTMESSVPHVFIAGTAIAGSRLGKTIHFIETSHKHVPRIIRALGGTCAYTEHEDRPENQRET